MTTRQFQPKVEIRNPCHLQSFAFLLDSQRAKERPNLTGKRPPEKAGAEKLETKLIEDAYKETKCGILPVCSHTVDIVPSEVNIISQLEQPGDLVAEVVPNFETQPVAQGLVPGDKKFNSVGHGLVSQNHFNSTSLAENDGRQKAELEEDRNGETTKCDSIASCASVTDSGVLIQKRHPEQSVAMVMCTGDTPQVTLTDLNGNSLRSGEMGDTRAAEGPAACSVEPDIVCDIQKNVTLPGKPTEKDREASDEYVTGPLGVGHRQPAQICSNQAVENLPNCNIPDRAQPGTDICALKSKEQQILKTTDADCDIPTDPVQDDAPVNSSNTTCIYETNTVHEDKDACSYTRQQGEHISSSKVTKDTRNKGHYQLEENINGQSESGKTETSSVTSDEVFCSNDSDKRTVSSSVTRDMLRVSVGKERSRVRLGVQWSDMSALHSDRTGNHSHRNGGRRHYAAAGKDRDRFCKDRGQGKRKEQQKVNALQNTCHPTSVSNSHQEEDRKSTQNSRKDIEGLVPHSQRGEESGLPEIPPAQAVADKFLLWRNLQNIQSGYRRSCSQAKHLDPQVGILANR